MGSPKYLDPSKSPRAFYGAELRRLREQASLTQDRLGELVFCSGAYLGQIEAAVRNPQMDMSVRLDEILNTGGLLTRLCELVIQSKHAEHFAEVADLEQKADTICAFAPTLITGLLQTELYARAVFRAGLPWASDAEIEERVRVRMDRTRLLESPDRPKLWVILHESALTLPVGNRGIMRAQMDHIAELMQARRAIVQVMPVSAGAHALMEGSLYLMTFQDAPAVAYSEGLRSGVLLDDPAVVADCRQAYDHVRAAAMSPNDSLDVIERLAEEVT
jgi:transcriptional regulator with XRE-family HTH domain